MCTPDRLSPVPVESDDSALPFGLTWAELAPAVPGIADAVGVRARVSHRLRGPHRAGSSYVLAISRPDGAERTVFVKRTAGEAAKYRFLASRGVPVPALLGAVPRPDGEVLVLEFLASIGIGPGDADELLRLIASLNSVADVPESVFALPPGRPAVEFDGLVRTALSTLEDCPVEEWLDLHRTVAGLVAELPRALNHGELHFQQVGWSAGRLVVLDVETMAMRPRYTDLAGVLAALAGLTGRAERELFASYAAMAGGADAAGGSGGAGDDAWRELLLTRVARSFASLPWLTTTRDDAAVDTPTDVVRLLRRDLAALGRL